MDKKEITFFARTSFRNERKKFGIKKKDRRRHFYVIGKTGTGKTAMIKNMAIQDIREGRGVAFVDPHGEAAEELLDFIPSHRINDVVYFNPADLNYPIAFNVMEQVGPEKRHLISSGLLGVFKKIWPDVWSARMEYILSNTLLALLEYPGATLLGINRMMGDADYRKKVLSTIEDPVIKAFWTKEFARYSQQYAVEATAAIQNKIGQFISAPLIRNIVGQVQSTIDIREVMDDQKIFIVNLATGLVGEDTSLLLGGLILSKLQLAAMSRVDVPEEERKDFYLYVDEFQRFATRSFASILSEARKYRLNLTLAHQYIAQMEEEVRDAVFGNVGTIVSFRVGPDDAEFLELEFKPQFYAEDLVDLPNYNIYVKLMIDGVASRGFSAETLPPFPRPKESHKEKIIKVSRERYGTEREEVEAKIKKWLGFLEEMEVKVPTKLYDITCSICGEPAKVPFKPDPDRPVYCKSCLKKVQRGDVQPPKKVVKKEKKKPKPASIEAQAEEKKKKKKKPAKKGDKGHLTEVREALSRALKKRNDEKN